MELIGRESKRVAFFGGSFDPPHQGHLAVARAARSALKLDEVMFAPVGTQPLKPAGSTASFADRVAMTRLAIAGEAGFTVSLIDAPNPAAEPNYSLDTLLRLQQDISPHGRLFCLMGADSFLSLRRWRGAAEIPFAAWLIVASRPGESLDDLKDALPEGLSIEPAEDAIDADVSAGGGFELRSFLLRNQSGETAPLYLLPGLHEEVSASSIRERIRELAPEETPRERESGASQQRIVPDAVLAYIRRRHLYE